MDLIKYVCSFLAILWCSVPLTAQEVFPNRCGTMQRLENKFLERPGLKAEFELQRAAFNRVVNERSRNKIAADEEVVYTIPVVFHIVMNNPNLVTNAMIQAQLDTLNKGLRGLNGDSVKIPTWFKALFGKSGIQFCLAQRTPNGQVSTGIERVVTLQTSFNNSDDRVKHVSTGGADIWDQSKYFNIWICQLSNSVLGYATFPNEGQPNVQGVVVDYRSLPGGGYANYNTGKTLVHETGHYFNLLHIWGDDDGGCSGTDFVDDTPNQSNSTSGCFTGIKTDNCTPSGNGVMYQNFMDYTNDACLLMFTKQQASRMQQALLLYRSSLLSSNGCRPVVNYNYDAELGAITQPLQRLCAPSFTPIVTLRNTGAEVLTSAVITVKVDDVIAYTYNWTGSLATLASTSIFLNALTVVAGKYLLTISVSQPSNNTDEDISNNSLSLTIQYYPPVSELAEGFEGAVFPPIAWDVVNIDNSVTWVRSTVIAKSGAASAIIGNYSYQLQGQKDDLRAPTLVLEGIDSAFLSYQVAASSNAATNGYINNNDTLEVLVSTDCGKTYTVVDRKWQTALSSVTVSSNSSFAPTSNQWRKDSVNLSAYIGVGPFVVAFRNTNENQNNIYLDDVNLRKVIVNPNLKSRGVLITPNPSSGDIAVQFYPQPVELRAIQLYNSQGQKMAEKRINMGETNNYYSFNMAAYASGVYIVRIVFSDTVITRKIIRL